MARVYRIPQFLPATHTTILTLLRKHSPDGTTRTRRHTSDIAYYSIYRYLKDKRLSWPSWLTYSGRLTHISGHPSAAGRAWDREVRWSKTNVLTTVPRNQPKQAVNWLINSQLHGGDCTLAVMRAGRQAASDKAGQVASWRRQDGRSGAKEPHDSGTGSSSVLLLGGVRWVSADWQATLHPRSVTDCHQLLHRSGDTWANIDGRLVSDVVFAVLLWSLVCLSVCLSVTSLCFIKAAEHSFIYSITDTKSMTVRYTAKYKKTAKQWTPPPDKKSCLHKSEFIKLRITTLSLLLRLHKNETRKPTYESERQMYTYTVHYKLQTKQKHCTIVVYLANI